MYVPVEGRHLHKKKEAQRPIGELTQAWVCRSPYKEIET